MGHRTFACMLAVTAVATGLGCGRETPEDIAVARAALSVCEEAVPADRNVDGIPSYAQCSSSENSAIYSNNGVDTSTEKVGPDWVRTQWSGGYQCTELAHRYLYFKWDIDWLPNGNAGEWCNDIPPEDSGVVQTDTPVHGDIMVLANGSCGASAEFGHVTVVDVVDASGKLTVVEQNGARRGRYEASCASCFLHVVANTGDGGASGIGGVGGTGGAGGAGGAGGIGGAGGGAPPAGGASGIGGAGGVGGGVPSGGAGGIGGAGGAGAVGGVAGMVASGGAGGMSDMPVAGAAAAGVGGTIPPSAGAQATAPIDMPRDAAAPESCSVARVGGQSSTLSWSAIGLALMATVLLRRRRS